MMTGTIIGRRAAMALAGFGLAGGFWMLRRNADRPMAPAPAPAVSTSVAAAHPSFLYGKITTVEGATYTGRLRFGGDQEAFWGDYFNGRKMGNPWVSLVPAGALPMERTRIPILELKLGQGKSKLNLNRPIMVRFGDIAIIEAKGRHLWVTLKSGTRYHLARYAADDFADGLRIWSDDGKVVTLHERRIRRIELLSAPGAGAAAPARLHGTVRTAQGDFTGFLQWNRREGLGLDQLNGRSAAGEYLNLPFQTIRSIARHSATSAQVTLHDGREVVLSDSREVGEGNGGVYVDDARYGRVLISWEAFERVDFSAPVGSSGPAYTDFPAGRPLSGVVTTRGGRSLTGHLVFDLDESQITETLDASLGGVDYTIPFGMVASIVLPGAGDLTTSQARVILQSGEELQLERAGDLGAGNAGLLIFVAGSERPQYVSWTDIQRLDFDRVPGMYPAIGKR